MSLLVGASDTSPEFQGVDFCKGTLIVHCEVLEKCRKTN